LNSLDLNDNGFHCKQFCFDFSSLRGHILKRGFFVAQDGGKATIYLGRQKDTA